MNFHLNMHCDSAAFHEETSGEFEPGPELARILHAIADAVGTSPVQTYDHYQTILDVNGNDVGRFALKEG